MTGGFLYGALAWEPAGLLRWLGGGPISLDGVVEDTAAGRGGENMSIRAGLLQTQVCVVLSPHVLPKATKPPPPPVLFSMSLGGLFDTK